MNLSIPGQQFENVPRIEPAAALPCTPFDAPRGSWTLAVLPDTQKYSAFHPEVFMRITEWIAAHKESHNIRFVFHEGDIVDSNLHPQWSNAHRAIDRLLGASVPFALTLGNHDMHGELGATASRESLVNEYFDALCYRHSRRVGFFEPCHIENSWHEFSTPTGDFLLVALEFGSRLAVLDWAGKVIAAHPGHRVIVGTHAYLYHDGTRYDWATWGDRQSINPMADPFAKTCEVTDGEILWQRLIRRHANIDFVLCGHTGGTCAAYLASPNDHGRTVHQIMANYIPRHWAYGGGGFIRLMQFHPDDRNVRVRTYSPWYDLWLEESRQCFSLALDRLEARSSAMPVLPG